MARRFVSEFKRTFWRPVDPTDPFDDVNRFSMRIAVAIGAAMALAVAARLAALGPSLRDLASFATTLLVIAACIAWMPSPATGDGSSVVIAQEVGQ